MSAQSGKRDGVRPLILLCCVQLMLLLDFSIVNVALPVIGHQFGLSRSGLQWVAASYGLTLGGLLLLGGDFPTCWDVGGCSWRAWPSSAPPRFAAGSRLAG